MSLDPGAKKTYVSNLEKAFKEMKNDDDFAHKVSYETAEYVKKGSIITTDVGGISAGAFTGTGKGAMSVDFKVCKQVIAAAVKAMASMTTGGDKYLADNIAKGIDDMVLVKGKAKTDVIGTVVTPSGASTPMSGKAEGHFSDNNLQLKTILATKIFAIFQAMSNMTEGGDKYLAQEMEKAVTNYLSSGTINTNGKQTLMGSVGTGKII